MIRTNQWPKNKAPNLHQLIVAKIHARIPKRADKIHFLVHLLQISKDSAYRRLLGTTSFTLDEVLSIASKLGFSLDNLLVEPGRRDKAIFDVPNYSDSVSLQIQKQIKNYLSIFEDNKNKSDSEYTLVTNHLPFGLILDSKLLYKFNIYYCLYGARKLDPLQRFASFTLPEKLLNLQINHQSSSSSFLRGTLIVDDFMYLSILNKLSFFKEKGLLDEAELKLLKAELLASISKLEQVASSGTYNKVTPLQIYLSRIKIDSSYLYINRGRQKESYFVGFGASYFKTVDPQVCSMQKKWTKELLQYSSFITKSNEVARFNFFDRLRKTVKSIKS